MKADNTGPPVTIRDGFGSAVPPPPPPPYTIKGLLQGVMFAQMNVWMNVPAQTSPSLIMTIDQTANDKTLLERNFHVGK